MDTVPVPVKVLKKGPEVSVRKALFWVKSLDDEKSF
jgi:hypothetical protein